MGFKPSSDRLNLNLFFKFGLTLGSKLPYVGLRYTARPGWAKLYFIPIWGWDGIYDYYFGPGWDEFWLKLNLSGIGPNKTLGLKAGPNSIQPEVSLAQPDRFLGWNCCASAQPSPIDTLKCQLSRFFAKNPIQCFLIF